MTEIKFFLRNAYGRWEILSKSWPNILGNELVLFGIWFYNLFHAGLSRRSEDV